MDEHSSMHPGNLTECYPHNLFSSFNLEWGNKFFLHRRRKRRYFSVWNVTENTKSISPQATTFLETSFQQQEASHIFVYSNDSHSGRFWLSKEFLWVPAYAIALLFALLIHFHCHIGSIRFSRRKINNLIINNLFSSITRAWNTAAIAAIKQWDCCYEIRWREHPLSVNHARDFFRQLTCYFIIMR